MYVVLGYFSLKFSLKNSNCLKKISSLKKYLYLFIDFLTKCLLEKVEILGYSLKIVDQKIISLQSGGWWIFGVFTKLLTNICYY